MASSPKKKASKKPAKPKAQRRRRAPRKRIESAGEESHQPAKKSAARQEATAARSQAAKGGRRNLAKPNGARKNVSAATIRRHRFLPGKNHKREKARSVHSLPEREVAPTARCDGRFDGGSRERQSPLPRGRKRGVRLWDAPGRRRKRCLRSRLCAQPSFPGTGCALRNRPGAETHRAREPTESAKCQGNQSRTRGSRRSRSRVSRSNASHSSRSKTKRLASGNRSHRSSV